MLWVHSSILFIHSVLRTSYMPALCQAVEIVLFSP